MTITENDREGNRHSRDLVGKEHFHFPLKVSRKIGVTVRVIESAQLGWFEVKPTTLSVYSLSGEQCVDRV